MNIVFSALVGIRELRTIVYELKDVYVKTFFKAIFLKPSIVPTLSR